MFVESLFQKLPGVEVIKKPDHYYQIWISNSEFKNNVPKLKTIFWDNYERVSLISRTHKHNKFLLVVLWRHLAYDVCGQLSEEAIQEAEKFATKLEELLHG